MAEIICPQCKTPNRGTAQFCSECGTPLLEGLEKRPPDETLVSDKALTEEAAPDKTSQRAAQEKTSEPAAPEKKPEPLLTKPIEAAEQEEPKILQNRYRIEEELGQGGFGSVYKAWDINLNRRCAIKENLATTGQGQSQFKREAMVLANLSHPNLPRVIDHFIIPKQGQYLVMDFVEGDDLESLLKKREVIPAAEAIGWVLQVAEALDYLHRQQPPIFHRDVKPANIRVTPAGKAMLVDFGLVKIFDLNLITTQAARAVSPGYAPPEQYGRGGTDARTDIYGLGATLFALVTGHEPVESVRRMAGERQPSAAELNPGVSRELSDVIARSISLDPNSRYAKAADFRDALRQVGSNTQQTMIGKRPGGPYATIAVDAEDQEKPDAVNGAATIAAQGLKGVTGTQLRGGGAGTNEVGAAGVPDASSEATVVGMAKLAGLQTEKLAETQTGKPLVLRAAAPPNSIAAQESLPPINRVGYSEKPSGESGESRSNTNRKKKLLIGGIGAVVVILCLVLGGSLAAWLFGDKQVDPVEQTLTAHAELVSPVGATLTAHMATNSVGVEATKSDGGTDATRTVEPSVTSLAESPTETATQIISTAPSTKTAGATEQGIRSDLAKMDEIATLVYGPKSGRLLHKAENGLIETISASVGVRNFITEVSFTAPYDAADNEWDFGMLLRHGGENIQYRLVFLSDKSWLLTSQTGDAAGKTIAEGTIDSMKIGDGETNKIRVYGIEDTGYFFFNDEFIAEFDFSQHYSGGIMIGIGFYEGTEQTGKLTPYGNFSVWTLPANP